MAVDRLDVDRGESVTAAWIAVRPALPAIPSWQSCPKEPVDGGHWGRIDACGRPLPSLWDLRVAS